MKINEVEALAGISKKNIRFYEEQGLLKPSRNAENGYRDYSQEDVLVLRRIRLLRKLDVPIEEIRQMFSGTHTLGDGMRRHLITLEREQRNLQQAIELCQELTLLDIPAAQMDADTILARMETMEQSGTTFPDASRRDTRYIAPVVITALTVALMTALCGLLLWALWTSPENSPPAWFVAFPIAIFIAIGVGCIAALTQRVREIRKGEMNDAKKY